MRVAPVHFGLQRRREMADEPGGHDDSAGSKADPLRLVLHTMEEQLDDRVDAVGKAGPSHDESTSELIKLEETLSSAQDKAKQLVTLRLKLDEEESESARSDASTDDPPPPAGSKAPGDAPASPPANDRPATR